MKNRDQIFFYGNVGRRDQLEIALAPQKMWMSEWEIARLFEMDVWQIREGIRDLMATGELESEGMVRFRSVAGEELRGPSRAPDPLFHLQVVLALGLRLQSPQAIRYRRWAVETVFQALGASGSAASGEEQNGHADFFHKQKKFLLDLRGSSLGHLTKVVQLFASSPDYDPVSEIARKFWSVLCVCFPFSTRQNDAHRSGNDLFEEIPSGEKEKVNQLYEALQAFAERETRGMRVIYMSEWLNRVETFGEQDKLRQLVHNCQASE